MMRSLDASRWQIFRRLEAPTALPYVFSGAKIAVAVAVIGAVFGEWSGSSEGLGYLMHSDNGRLETARMFASVVDPLGLRDRALRPARLRRAQGRELAMSVGSRPV